MRSIRGVFLIIVLLSCLSCLKSRNKYQDNNSIQGFIEALYSGQTFLIREENDSLGEWGGTKTYLKLKGNLDRNGVVLDLKKVYASHEPPPVATDSLEDYYGKLTIIDTSNIKLNNDQVILAMKSISELFERKLVSSVSSKFCQEQFSREIASSDSTLFIQECNSVPWKNLQELKRSLNIK